MKKYILSTAVIALAVIGSAFTNARRTTTWVFTGNASQIKSASAYQQGIPEPAGCGSGTTLPCSIVTSASNQTDLQTFLTSQSEEAIVEMSDNKRN
ncbi:hypothetical protein [Desertivirga brevis]|uniref:hypothetical protein n=1 Tax=Desertivirga brevis TaxID=2810310 RepID=UPI001A95C58A|nr:hypothetical protein [Pedobacter sp. SYSU D00873]